MNEFFDLLGQQENLDIEGKVVVGTILSINKDFVIVDIGLKAEGYIPIKEYENEEILAGQETNVFVVFIDNANHECVLSHARAKKEEMWHKLEKDFASSTLVEGTIIKQVKGGLSIDLCGVNAFLPGSQIDSRLMNNIPSLIGVTQEFQIIKLDRAKGDIVISCKFQDRSFEEGNKQMIDNLKEGDICVGIVKNITNYGAFVNLGSIDGLLHLIDMSWTRINHPQEILNIGDKIELMIIKVDHEKKRVNLGLKQLIENPWKRISERCKPNTVIEGIITNVSDYGAFVEIEKGIEGLIHISEISWTKNDIPAVEYFKKGEKIKAAVLDCNVEKRRIALGLKQLIDNPWNVLADKYQANSIIKGTIANIDPARGMNIRLEDGIEGMVGLSNISWESSGVVAIKNYNIGDEINVKIMEVNSIKGKLILSIKHLTEDPFDVAKKLEKGQAVTCTVSGIAANGLEVLISNTNVKGFININQLSSVRSECYLNKFAVNDRIDASIINVDNITGKVNLSIKLLEISEKKRVIEEYGSASSGAQLGDILGFALDETKRKLENFALSNENNKNDELENK